MGAIGSTPMYDHSGRTTENDKKKAKFVESRRVYLLENISWTRKESYSIKLKIEPEPRRRNQFLDISIVIGLAFNREQSGGLQNVFSFWNITQGKVHLPEGSIISVEKVKIDGEVVIHFIPGAAKVTLTITNPKEKAIRREVNILSKIPTTLHPFVGLLEENLTPPVTVSILDVVATNENDITSQVSFTKTFGIVQVVNSDKTIIEREQHQQGNGCALLPIKITKGEHHRWILLVHSDYGASVCVGLARYPFKMLDEYNLDQLKHIYKHPGLAVYRSYRGYLYKDGKEMSYSLEPLNWSQEHQHSIQLELIFDGDRLEILKNGRNMGTAFEGLTGSYQPIVAFYAAYSKRVELKNYYTAASLCDVLVLTSPLSSLETDGAAPTSKERARIIHYDEFCFDSATLFGKVSLTEDKKTIFRSSSQSGNAFCFCNIKCSQNGLYRFSFVIEVDQGASTCVGVTNATNKNQVHIPGHLYHSKELYLYRSFQGMVYLGGNEQSRRFEEFWMSGSLVEMEVQVKNEDSQVQFKVNGSEQGTVLPGLKTPLSPAVAFYSGMEKRVTFLHFEFQTVSEPHKSVISRDSASSGINDTSSTMTHAPRPPLSAIANLSDAAESSPCCKQCSNSVDIIPLPCKHAFLCSQHLSLALNAPTRRCAHCGSKITQLWNIF